MVLVAGCVRGSAGPVLRSQGSSGEVAAFRAVREGEAGSLPVLAPARPRCRLGWVCAVGGLGTGSLGL